MVNGLWLKSRWGDTQESFQRRGYLSKTSSAQHTLKASGRNANSKFRSAFRTVGRLNLAAVVFDDGEADP
jgi:hypothetical protein